VTGAFDGGTITSDGGGLVLREVERGTGVIASFAGCFTDYRDPRLVEHSVEALVAQRVYGLALGYEDLNDHDDLRRDPLLAVLAGQADCEGKGRARRRDRGKALAGKSTLNRLELATPEGAPSDRYKKIALDEGRAGEVFVDLFLRVQAEAPEEIILDLDATDDPLHGGQEGRFFHGYYRDYCYLPLYVFCGDFLLCAKLRPSNIDVSQGAAESVERIVGRIRQRWPTVKIVLRGDSGFCREALMGWCEAHGVDYLFGLAKNTRLTGAIGAELEAAETRFNETGRAARIFKDFPYRTRESWSRSRRVIAKAEHLEKGANPRFIVTSLDGDARRLYEAVYCARGDMENRIKEQQLYLFADRTSAATMRANQIRLWFSSLAYTLLHLLRHLCLKGTRLARAQCQTLRLKLLKIGARVRVTARRIWVSFTEACPYADLLRLAAARLRTLHVMRC
jgi:hypothetical protein